MKKVLTAIFVFLLAVPYALGEEGISVRDPWVRQNPPGTSVTAAYMVIENSAAAADELVDVFCECASRASLHVTQMSGDSMVMRKVDSIALPAGGSTDLSPGGHHVMLEGLSGKMGKSVVLELKFRSDKRIRVKAPVVSPQDTEGHGHHHH